MVDAWSPFRPFLKAASSRTCSLSGGAGVPHLPGTSARCIPEASGQRCGVASGLVDLTGQTVRKVWAAMSVLEQALGRPRLTLGVDLGAAAANELDGSVWHALAT